MITLMLLGSLILFIGAYFIYGRFLDKQFDVNDQTPTPSHADYDGIDRVPANKAVLLGHHFSSIAGAGPIVGPIIAAVAFGWLPALLWIVFGSIFIGGVHDFSSLIASIRHRARSIAEIAREYMSTTAYKLFLAFIWLTLVYVLTVFTDLTTTTFIQDDGVATSSIIFILLAIGFGFSIYKLKIRVIYASLIFVPLVFLAVWLGQQIPITADIVPAFIKNDPARTWNLALIAYAFIASTTPVWILLQPRDYLSSFLLYASVLGGFLGILFGGFALQYPAFTAFHIPELGSLAPILFITVACGACSGFHSIVASGTSSKQLNKESDARTIGYGSMLIEGFVAVISLATVAILVKGDATAAREPLFIYGSGMGKFLNIFGIPPQIGYSFGLLALSTFILTTLDTATRLGRYIFEEFFKMKGAGGRYLATLATLLLPTIFLMITLKDANGNPLPAWKAIWPVFGATNQLLAGLALLVVSVWLKRIGKNMLFVALPMLFMLGMTLWALVLLITKYQLSTVGVIALALLVMALLLVVEGITVFRKLFFSEKQV
jgi:carbon starvation protein